MFFTLTQRWRRSRRSHPLVTSLTPAQVVELHRQGNESALHGSRHSAHVGDFVFGGIDGAVTTFAVVAGVAGADLPAAVVLIAGLANLFADGFAMGIGNFLSIRSEHEHYDRERSREAWEVDNVPDEERKEIEEIYRRKGFTGDALQSAVVTITADRERWIDTMLQEELGLARDRRSALKGGLVTFTAFIVLGFIPLLSFVGALFVPSLKPYTFVLAVALTVTALFLNGALKSLVVDRPPLRSGSEVLLLGGCAATVAYFVGYLLRGLNM